MTLPWFAWLILALPWCIVALLLLSSLRERRKCAALGAARFWNPTKEAQYNEAWDQRRHVECIAALQRIERRTSESSHA